MKIFRRAAFPIGFLGEMPYNTAIADPNSPGTGGNAEMVTFWVAATIVFVAVELATIGLTSIWFALGSLCALIAALLGAPLWLQIVWFVIISVAALLLTRPLVKKYINGRTQATNADRVIGQTAVVKERIDNLAETGAVLAGGKIWTARSADGSTIEADAQVVVREIQGVKLIVEQNV